MPKSPEEMAAAMIANLKDKTGKTLPQWLKIVKSSKLAKHGEIVKNLKSEFGIGHGFAGMIAHEFLKPPGGAAPPDQLVNQQYSGGKSDLKPIYDAIITAVSKFGSDVEVSPKKAYVSLRRSKQFAIVQPSTKDRVDVGLNLKGIKADGRLEAAGSFNAMVSHRVRISNKKEVDLQLKKWLKAAYESA